MQLNSALRRDRLGSLGLKENRVEWYDTKDSKRNFSFFGDVIQTVWLECEPRPQGNFCYKLGMKTLTGETHNFRDVDWKTGGNAHILHLYQAIKDHYPQAIFQEKVKTKS